ncbi:MAG TPA: FAD-dependent oxidoreductase [Pirellulales bacterium]|nr:FAD-dependent oxidoreductase [Pirellulales bacterium]
MAIVTLEEAAFPHLNDAELDVLRESASERTLADGEILFRAGQPEIDFNVVESGALEIINPVDGDRLITTHGPRSFAGDIDMLTGRPVNVTARAAGETHILHLPNSQLRSLLNRVPSLGEKLMNAFTTRRKLLMHAGNLGLRVVGPGRCRDTAVVREFLYKNFVPFNWYDPDTPEGHKVFEELGSPKKTPVIETRDGRILLNPTLRQLAQGAGIWRQCPSRSVDLSIVGAGPAGITTAVYAASEGLSTLLVDRLGPGGQAGGSSRIENFIGFPAGLSGAELAARGVLQLLKFGGNIVAPVDVEKITPAPERGAPHIMHLDCGAQIHSRVILVATGVRWRKLEAAGADRYERAGIYYACTMVEADLYDRADVAVVGAGNSAGQAVMFLAECCPGRRVHLLIRRTLGPGMSSYLANRIRATSNVVIHEHSEIDVVHGGRHVEEIEIRNNESGERRRMPCAAVFVFIGAEPVVDWLPAGIARDANGYLLTGSDALRSGRWPCADRDPCPLETSIPGILAAGDIRAGATKRVGFAVGDGSLAVTCAHRLLSIQY